jgi:hypothetical protein
MPLHAMRNCTAFYIVQYSQHRKKHLHKVLFVGFNENWVQVNFMTRNTLNDKTDKAQSRDQTET